MGVTDLKTLFAFHDLERFRTASIKDRQHPLRRLFFPLDHDDAMVSNTDLALDWIFRLDPKWIESKVKCLVGLDNFEATSSFLGEVRAYGLTLSTGLRVKPFKGKESGPDFLIDDRVHVEVHAKQSEPAERLALQKNNESPKAFHPNSPFGAPSAGDSVTTVAIQKVAQIKQKEEHKKNQFSATSPSILWIDFQDETWQLILGSESAFPVNVWNDEYYSGVLWYGFYGWKGAPVFQGETKLQRPRRIIARMQHNGRFRGNTNIDAVIISLMRYTFLFENPFSKKTVPPSIVEKLLRLPHVDKTCSLINGSGGDLYHRIEQQQRDLDKLATEAIYGW